MASSPTSKPTALLEQHMKPLDRYLKTGGKDVTDICINRPGEIFIDSKSHGWKQHHDKEITEERLRMLAEVIATTSGQKFNDEYPILATDLPGYGYRCHILNKSIAYDGISVSIRKSTADKYPISSYFAPIPGLDWKKEICNAKDPHEAIADEIKPLLEQGKEDEAISILMKKGGAVVVCGGTSSGKTSFVNSMVESIPLTERIITIEDTHELQLPHKNRVHIVKSKSGSDIGKVSYSEVIDSTNRMRPDRVFFGELDVPSTLAFLRSINTGHRGSMATVHANSPERVISALVMNLQLANFPANEVVLEKYVRTLLTAIVFARCIEWGGQKYFRSEVVLLK